MLAFSSGAYTSVCVCACACVRACVRVCVCLLVIPATNLVHNDVHDGFRHQITCGLADNLNVTRCHVANGLHLSLQDWVKSSCHFTLHRPHKMQQSAKALPSLKYLYSTGAYGTIIISYCSLVVLAVVDAAMRMAPLTMPLQDSHCLHGDY